MPSDSLRLDKPSRDIASGVTREEPFLSLHLGFNGLNEDIVDSYYWHLHFPYFVGKGYTFFKFEDYHYFSEASQYGMNLRQIKGGSIKAFQENLNQLVTLIKVHLMPLLKEVKQAEFYYNFFNAVEENDRLYHEEIEKGNKNSELAKKYRKERDEALNHIKDKWVTEVDGGRLWQMNKPASEQGLDFALLPQLFFGLNFEDPLQRKRTLKEQLDDDIYTIDISLLAKEQVARFLYKFYTWLGPSIKETRSTYRIKIAALKQFYSQIQMYITFMKPLLIEISKKSEGLEADHYFKGFEIDNPEIVNLFDYSYSFIKLFGIRNYTRQSVPFKVSDIEMSRFGLYLSNPNSIKFGEHKGKKGFLFGQSSKDEKKYKFLEFDKNPSSMNTETFNKLKEEWNKDPVYVDSKDLISFPIMMVDFSQRRRVEIVRNEQGSAQVPHMRNDIKYRGFVWDLFEIATYRESLKIENLELLETFIEEVRIIKDEILYYVSQADPVQAEKFEDVVLEEKKPFFKNLDFTFITAPITGLGKIMSPLFVSFTRNSAKNRKKADEEYERDDYHLRNKLYTADDVWKGYTIYKVVKGFIKY